MATNQYLGDGPISGVTHRVVTSRPIKCAQLSSNLPRVKKIAHGIWLQKINIGIKTKLFAQEFTMDTDSFLKKIILKMGTLLSLEIN